MWVELGVLKQVTLSDMCKSSYIKDVAYHSMMGFRISCLGTKTSGGGRGFGDENCMLVQQ